MARDYGAILHAMHNTCWAIMPEKLQAMFDFLDLKSDGRITAADVEAAVAQRRDVSRGVVRSGVAVLPLVGVIAQKMDLMTEMSGGTSTERFGQRFDELMADDAVKSIVFDVDSPGGNVYGIPELTEKIRSARGGKKRITAVANSLMTSGAYWIGSAADEIVVTPSGEAGSIGVVARHTDYSQAESKAGRKHTFVHGGRYKVEANPLEPLDDEARDFTQKRVDEYYDAFITDVAKNRNIRRSAVVPGYGEGRVFGAAELLERGMADRIGTLEETIERVRPKGRSTQSARARLEL